MKRKRPLSTFSLSPEVQKALDELAKLGFNKSKFVESSVEKEIERVRRRLRI